MPKVLLIEHDLSVAQLLQFTLESERYVIDHYTHCADALHALRLTEYDLLILDWSLPDGTGIDLCKQYRDAGGNRPILMLTARDTSSDKVTGLTSGADDYVVKPFDPDELIARTRALLRRPPVVADVIIRLADVTLNKSKFTLTIGDHTTQLVAKEFAILQLLMEHPGRFFTAESILARVWRNDMPVSSDSVRTNVKTLRKKFNDAHSTTVIENSRGLGYRIKAGR